MKKILFMNASPNRDGSTSVIAEKLLSNREYDRLQMSDYEVSQYGVVKSNDQIKDILNIIKNYDTLVIGSPVYFYTVSGILKTFIDRLYLLDEAKVLEGKNVYFFADGYSPDKETEETIKHLITNASRVVGFNVKGLVVDNSNGNKVLSELNIEE